jgi:WD40-like Beta Propeller Repeat
MARKNHFVGALAVAAGILAAVGMLVLMTLVVKVGPARAQEGPNFAFSLAYAGTGSGPSGTGPGPGESRDIQVLLNYECPVGSGSFGCTSWRAIGLPYMPNSVPNSGPAWSPNGSRIAFSTAYNPDGGNDSEIYTIDNTGNALFVPGSLSNGTGDIPPN